MLLQLSVVLLFEQSKLVILFPQKKKKKKIFPSISIALDSLNQQNFRSPFLGSFREHA